MTPEDIAAEIGDIYEDQTANSRSVSEVYGHDTPEAVFYVDVHNPGEGNQRFSVTVADCTDISKLGETS